MRKMSLLLVGVLVLGLSIPTLAAEVIDWVRWHKDRIEDQKVLIDARVVAGLITKAQADLWKQTIDARQEAIEANPDAFVPGSGVAFGQGFGTGFAGRGMHHGGFGGMMMSGNFGPMFAR